jgi:hypothetical protein
VTKRLHLVFGGELIDPAKNAFKNVDDIHMVGMFPTYAAAYAAWKSEAYRTVDNAHIVISLPTSTAFATKRSKPLPPKSWATKAVVGPCPLA